MLSPEKISRFWAFVATGGENDCWEWQRSRTGKGYGRFCPGGGRYVLTHRYALASLTGIMPPRTVLALHSCDNPPCCNPMHLRWGSYSDNKRDRDERRGYCRDYAQIRGSGNPRAILTEGEVTQILLDNRIAREVARDFGVKDSTIYNIRRGSAWKHVPRPAQQERAA